MNSEPRATLDTPALLADLDVMKSNIAHIAQFCRSHGVQWRPHFKGHKTVEVAQMQISAGAIGITCAKLGEAEILAANGIGDIMIANQIVGALKVRRLMRVKDGADVIVAVDGVDNVRELAAAAGQAGKTLRVVIEVNIGMNRAGTAPGEPTLALADEIARHPDLRLVGVMGWEAQTTGIADPGEKEKAVKDVVARINKQLADFERIRRFRVLDREFTIERGELTPTMKIRRAQVLENHKDLVSELYLGREESE